MITGTRKHEILLEKLRDRLEKSNPKYVFFCHEDYSLGKLGPRGEIDLMARLGDNLLIFEIKSSSCEKSLAKAHDQLDRAYKYAKEYSDRLNYSKMYFFGVYGAKDGKYNIEWYKPKKE